MLSDTSTHAQRQMLESAPPANVIERIAVTSQTLTFPLVAYFAINATAFQNLNSQQIASYKKSFSIEFNDNLTHALASFGETGSIANAQTFNVSNFSSPINLKTTFNVLFNSATSSAYIYRSLYL
jgi:hypothetical protein